MKVVEKFTSINGEVRVQENLQFLSVLKGVTCDVVIVILCGLIHLSAHIKKKPRKKY